MFSKENFTKEHINFLKEKTHRDPALLERIVFAFGLIEALKKVGLSFVFKGGTCLSLLLNEQKRISTDIDIVVAPGSDIQTYINEASVLFPFKTCEEVIRQGKNRIIKKHFKFTYTSPLSENDFYILLDVVFEENNYPKLVTKKLDSIFLINSEPYLFVNVPAIDCLVGDKLTAFAPHTSGILLNQGKDLEIMKQMFDIGTLFDYIEDSSCIFETYEKVAKVEIGYRDFENNITVEDCLFDTFTAAICIASRGKYLPDDYRLYLKGIRELRSYIFDENYSPETAIIRATKTAYLSACLITGEKTRIIKNTILYSDKEIQTQELKCCSNLRKTHIEAFGYLVETDKIILKYKSVFQHRMK